MVRIFAAFLILTATAGARAQEDVYPGDSEAPPPEEGPTYDDFKADTSLNENGEWVETAEYGLIWRPTRVGDEWRPYWDGHWVYTTAGWAWMSDESFGWATYHYGRWAVMDDLGWVWLPGRVWAPAWVAWRWGDGYAGWCPLGPQAFLYEQPRHWVFVGSRNFLD